MITRMRIQEVMEDTGGDDYEDEDTGGDGGYRR